MKPRSSPAYQGYSTMDPQPNSMSKVSTTRDVRHDVTVSKSFATNYNHSISAKEETTSHQRWFFRLIIAAGATVFFWPSKFGNIIEADIVAAKPFIKLLKCFRVINAANRVS